MIINRYTKKCQSCDKKVNIGEGFAYKNGFVWLTVCASTACHRKLGVKAPDPEAETKRELSEDGFIRMPFDRAALPFLRSMPGAKWNPDIEGKPWSVSIEPADLPRVIEVCNQLKIEVPDLLLEQASEGTEESREALERAERLRDDGKGLFPFQKKGVEFLALHNRALLADDMGLGKQHSIDTLILTPTGKRAIGDICVGDYVIGSDGNPTQVTGVFPQGVKPSYALILSDGLEVESGPEHLWAVEYYIGGRKLHRIIVTTDQIRTGAVIETKWPNRGISKLNLAVTKLYIPMLSGPVKFESQCDLKIPAYTMGALLGNGYLTGSQAVLTVNALDWPEFKAFISNEGVIFGAINTYKGATHMGINGIMGCVRELGINLPSSEKRIPENYFFSSPESRIALLQGLMDTDGSCSKTKNKVTFHSTSLGLSKDICRLVRELGGLATLREYDRTKENKPIEYQVRVKLPQSILPFRIKRKAERYVPANRSRPTRSVVEVRYVRDVESVCISVAAEDHLYVCADCIVTHNTVQALVALPSDQRVILICPAAVKYNWRKEAQMWRPDYNINICSGRGNFTLPGKKEITITNYDILPTWMSPTKNSGNKTKKGEVIKVANFTKEQEQVFSECTLICDESHLVKNYKTSRSKKVSQIALIARRVWFLTGTPLMNRPTDLYGVLCSGNMNVLGSWSKFLQLFNGMKGPFGGYEFGLPEPEVPERMKRVMIRRLKTEVLKELPPKTYKDIEVNNLNKELKKTLDKIAEDAIVDGDLITNNLPNFTEFSKIRAKLAESRIPAMIEIAESYEETETPLVIFSAHKKPIKELAKREGWKTITGDTSAEERFRIVEDFQSGNLKGVGCTIQAGGVGLTLTLASHALFVDLDWTPGLNIQAEDRIARIGQTATAVLIMRMVSSHPLDIHMHQLIALKTEIAQKALEESLKFKPLKKRLKTQEVQLIEETDEELAERIANAEVEAEREVALTRLEKIAAREAVKVNDVPEPPLTNARKKMLRKALEYMVERCDGAVERDGIGFSKPDAGIGHWLDATGLRDDDEMPFRVLERILVRYRRQLKGEFEAIWKPD